MRIGFKSIRGKNVRQIPEESFLNDFSWIFTVNKSIVNSDWPEFSSGYTADEVCGESSGGPFLLAAIPSVVRHIHQRRAIRQTWGSVAYGKTGSRTREEEEVLRAESLTYGDIVQADFEDSYGTLSLKTLTMLRWMTIHCPLAKHLLKVDEDTFVNIPLLLRLLATLTSHNTRYVIGFIYTSQPSKVLRHGKWAVAPPLYPAPYYPYYTVGHSYVISGACVRDVTSAYRHFRLLAIEDAFFTGIIAKTLNITRLNCGLFASSERDEFGVKCPHILSDYKSPARDEMNMLATKMMVRAVCVALLPCLLWLLYLRLSVHTPVRSTPTHLLHTEHPHVPSSRTQLVPDAHALYRGPAEGTHLPRSPDGKTERASKDHLVDPSLGHSLGSEEGKDLAENVNGDHNVKHETRLHIFYNNTAQIVSKVKVVLPDFYLAQNASFFRLRDTVVNRFDNPWLVQTTCPSEGPDLLIVIPSVHTHVPHRRAIRQTWGSMAYGKAWPGWSGSSTSNAASVKLIFCLGVSELHKRDRVLHEAETYQDIVMGDFIESYQNLSLKMAMVLQWVDDFCPGAKNVLKADEDTFVHVPLLLDVLVARQGRWEVPLEEYPLPYWPKYMYGHSYVISGDAIRSLRHASQHMPLVTNEDAYVTGILALSAGVMRVGSHRFAIVQSVYPRCALVQHEDISQTGIRPMTELYVVWKMLMTGNCSGGSP
ncbi:hypothetical protein ACOMHN_060424 [Nucella lapillus]